MPISCLTRAVNTLVLPQEIYGSCRPVGRAGQILCLGRQLGGFCVGFLESDFQQILIVGKFVYLIQKQLILASIMFWLNYVVINCL